MKIEIKYYIYIKFDGAVAFTNHCLCVSQKLILIYY